jgi:hypothetical protein
MLRKVKAGSFVDAAGYKEAVERYAKPFREQLANERQESSRTRGAERRR